jgi:hypothetical protein
VQCGKAFSYPCYKTLLRSNVKGEIGFPQHCFPNWEKIPTSPLTLLEAFKLFSALLLNKNKSKKQGARQLKDNRDIHKLTPF